MTHQEPPVADQGAHLSARLWSVAPLQDAAAASRLPVAHSAGRAALQPEVTGEAAPHTYKLYHVTAWLGRRFREISPIGRRKTGAAPHLGHDCRSLAAGAHARDPAARQDFACETTPFGQPALVLQKCTVVSTNHSCKNHEWHSTVIRVFDPNWLRGRSNAGAAFSPTLCLKFVLNSPYWRIPSLSERPFAGSRLSP